MKITETYYFIHQEFDTNGKRESDNISFRNLLKEFEIDFHTRHPNRYGQFMFANSRTMMLLSKSCNARDDMIYGMDLIDGEFNPTINHEIEKADNIGQNIVVYAIDSAYQPLDEYGIPVIDGEKDIFPLTLLVDDSLKNGTLKLMYPSDDSSDEEWIPEPININVKSF